MTIEPLKPVCPEGCSGYGGFGISGDHPASGSVLGLPSVSASLIAVIGRQNDQCALSSQTLIRGSAAVRYSTAKKRALSTSDSPSCAESVRKIRLHVPGGFSAQ